MGTKVPTLTAAGLVTDISAKLDTLLAYFLVSEKSQTALYGESVTSLNWLVATYGNDPNDLTINTRSALTAYFNRYFDTANIQVRTTNLENARYTLEMDINVIEDGTTYSAGKEVSIVDSKVIRIIDKLNG